MNKIIILLISVLFLGSCKNKQGIDLQQVNQNCKANAISVGQLTDMLYSKGIKDVQFVDIRTPHQYAISHLPGAINVPMKNFFDKRYFSGIPKDKVLLLYGEDASTPRLMALMSGHFKKGNFYVILGGYNFIKSKILDNYGVYTGLYDDEQALVDYQQFINELRSRVGGAKPVAKAKPAAGSKPIVKRKKKEVSGGCG